LPRAGRKGGREGGREGGRKGGKGASEKNEGGRRRMEGRREGEGEKEGGREGRDLDVLYDLVSFAFGESRKIHWLFRQHLCSGFGVKVLRL